MLEDGPIAWAVYVNYQKYGNNRELWIAYAMSAEEAIAQVKVFEKNGNIQRATPIDPELPARYLGTLLGASER